MQNPLPSPRQDGLWPPEALLAFAPYLGPQTLAFAEPVPLGLPVGPKPLSLSPHHFLHPGPCAVYSPDSSLPDSTAYDWLAPGPTRGVTCLGRYTFIQNLLQQPRAFCLGAQPSFSSLSSPQLSSYTAGPDPSSSPRWLHGLGLVPDVPRFCFPT